MGSRYFNHTEEFFVEADPEAVWRVLADPTALAGSHPIEVKPEGHIALTAGDRWIESHRQCGCGGDDVIWTTLVAENPTTYVKRGRQAGTTMTDTVRLRPKGSGCILRNRLAFSPSFVGRFPEKLVTWRRIATGKLPKMVVTEEFLDRFACILSEHLGCRVTRL